MRMKSARLVLLLALSLVPGTAFAQEKTLYWAELAVRARLDAEAVLHVEERHDMVFTGDWNGGERRFSVRLGQHLQLLRLSRIDPATGEAHALAEGDLSQVDQYSWVNNNTLRWRSRLPADPPFQETRIPYVLEYTLSGVLKKRDGVYRLSHQFAFPDRSGTIIKFALDFDLDPVWRPMEALSRHLERQYLAAGETVLVEANLAYQGAAADRLVDVRGATPAGPRRGYFAGSLMAMIVLYVIFRRREAALGRFSPPEVPREWDEAWLRENVFLYRPEEVGALWDLKVGSPEVAAVLARLVAEGKLASAVRPKSWVFGKDVLTLTLKVDRSSLEGYERRLIDKLFFGGNTETDTEAVRRHYKSSGFDP